MTKTEKIPNIKIRRFNPEILEKRRLAGRPVTIVVIGKRGSGKSTLIADILWYMKDIPTFFCMSGTEEGNGFYSEYMHPLCIHNEYKNDIVEKIFSQQKKKHRECVKFGIDPRTKPELGTGLLLDDCGFDKKIMNNQSIRQIFMNGRHFQICFIVSLQYMMGLPPDLRTNTDYVFCLRENIVNNQKKLYDNFFGCFKKFSHFQEAFNACTNNYECLVLDNTTGSTELEDCVFYYKAALGKEYKIGSKAMWDKLDDLYDDQYKSDDDEDNIRPNAIIKKAPMVKLVKKEI